MLLERLSPDVPVRSLPEAKSMLEAVGVLRRLWVAPPVGHGFETVAGLTGRQAAQMRAGADAQSADLVDAALAAREELLAGPPGDEVLLHGTFRQSKVLAGERTPWLAVGPDPLVGEGAFDLARLVRDRVEDLVAAPSGAVSHGAGCAGSRRRWSWTRSGYGAGRCSGRWSPGCGRTGRGGRRTRS